MRAHFLSSPEHQERCPGSSVLSFPHLSHLPGVIPSRRRFPQIAREHFSFPLSPRPLKKRLKQQVSGEFSGLGGGGPWPRGGCRHRAAQARIDRGERCSSPRSPAPGRARWLPSKISCGKTNQKKNPTQTFPLSNPSYSKGKEPLREAQREQHKSSLHLRRGAGCILLRSALIGNLFRLPQLPDHLGLINFLNAPAAPEKRCGRTRLCPPC